jgi:hypothetical protein
MGRLHCFGVQTPYKCIRFLVVATIFEQTSRRDSLRNVMEKTKDATGDGCADLAATSSPRWKGCGSNFSAKRLI